MSFRNKDSSIEFSIVIPCLNEAETLHLCIQKAKQFCESQHIRYEIVVGDNGSTDGSQEIARNEGARVVEVSEKGYGAALKEGIKHSHGKYIIMGDADNSYDFSNLSLFVLKLREGFDLVIGNRFKGGFLPGSSHWLNRYVGNPVLSFIGKLFFSSPVGDFHCGLRGFSREAYDKIDPTTPGMEFASEMIIRATLQGLNITEIPATLSPDGRSRPPHLRRWRDGWRHLRFMMLYSPKWIFFYPGLIFMIFGLVITLWLLPESRHLYGVTFDIHTLLFSCAMLVLGLQAVSFAVLTKAFCISEELHPQKNPKMETLSRYFNLELGIVIGLIFCVFGFLGSLFATILWGAQHFGELLPTKMLRLIIPSVTLMIIGAQVIFTSVVLGVMELGRQRKN